MASKTKYCSLLFIVAIFLMLAFVEASETPITKLTKSRKVLAMLKCNSGVQASTRFGNGEKVVARELRTAPSGPDPLHHHGSSPKKPRSDP